MKVFISVDIEGIASAVERESIFHGRSGGDYERYRLQMTKEAVAAAEGAREAGATEVVIKDAHGHGTNILPEYMPDYVKLIRGWAYEPDLMVEGIDESFDAAFFVGYHNAAGLEGNCLGHTISYSKVHSIKVNGEIASEFLIYSYMAAYYNVPSVLLTGDKMLCEISEKYHPNLITLPVKDDLGGRSESISQGLACKLIKESAKKALEQDLSKAKITLPEKFTVEVCYKDHALACAKSIYPGATKIDSYTIAFESNDWYEINRFFALVLL